MLEFSIGVLRSFKARAEFTHFNRCPLGGGTFAGDGDRLFAGFAGQQEETSNHLLRLGKGAINHDWLTITNMNASRARVGLQ